MKRILSLLSLLALLHAPPSFAAYAFVNCANNGGSGNTVSYSPTAGNLIVVLSGSSPGSGSPTASIADNKSDAYSTALATTSFDSGSAFVTVFYLPNVPSGITTLTLTYSGGTPGTTDILVCEYSGLATSSPLIVASGLNALNAPGTGTNAVISSTINVTSQPAALIGLSYDEYLNHMGSAGTSPLTFTARYGTASSDGLFIEDARLTSTGNTHTASTAATGADYYGVVALAFAETGGSGGCNAACAARGFLGN